MCKLSGFKDLYLAFKGITYVSSIKNLQSSTYLQTICQYYSQGGKTYATGYDMVNSLMCHKNNSLTFSDFLQKQINKRYIKRIKSVTSKRGQKASTKTNYLKFAFCDQRPSLHARPKLLLRKGDPPYLHVLHIL